MWTRWNHFFWGQLLLVCEHRSYQLACLFLSGNLKMFGLLLLMHAPSTSSCLCNVWCLCEFVNVHVLLLLHFWCIVCSYHLCLLLGNVWCCASLEICMFYYYFVFGTQCVMDSDVLHGYQSKYTMLYHLLIAMHVELLVMGMISLKKRYKKQLWTNGSLLVIWLIDYCCKRC